VNESGPTNRRQISGSLRATAETVWFLIIALGLVAAFELPSYFGQTFFREQYLALFLGLVLFVTFLAYGPIKRAEPATRVPVPDLVAAVAGLGTMAYAGLTYEDTLWEIHKRPPELVILGTMMVVLVIEACRRVAGLPLAIIGIVFISYAFVSDLMPGQLYNDVVPFGRIAIYLYLDANALLGLPLAIAIGIVLAFILFGSVLFRTGAGNFYTDFAMALMGRYRGGPAKVAIVASSLFGTISGSAVSNVVATGVVTIPLMRRSGFNATEAGAIEAVASTGGQIMPPIMGATAFLMAELLNLRYATIVTAALIPALLYYGSAFLQVHFMARRAGLAGVPVDPENSVWRVLRRDGIFLLPMLVILFALFHLHWRPEKAAFLAIAAAIAVFMWRRRGLGDGYWDMIVSAGETVTQITLITAVAGIIIGILNLTGLGFSLTLILTALGQHSLELLLVIVAALCILLGMGLPTAGIYLILAVMVGPAITELGVLEIAGHLFIFYFGVMSFITPPVCFAAFAASTISGAGAMRTGILAARLGIVAYIVPFVFIYNPGLLMMAPWHIVAMNLVLTLLGIVLISAAAVGFTTHALNMIERLIYAAAALALFAACTPATLLQMIAVGFGLAASAWFVFSIWRESKNPFPASVVKADGDATNSSGPS